MVMVYFVFFGRLPTGLLVIVFFVGPLVLMVGVAVGRGIPGHLKL